MSLARLVTQFKFCLLSMRTKCCKRRVLRGFAILFVALSLAMLPILHFLILPELNGSYEEECYTDKERAKMIRDAVQIICKTMEKHKVKYWLDYGVLLGVMTKGGLIPWDEDADISYLLSSNRAFRAHNELSFEKHISSNPLRAFYKYIVVDYMRWEEREVQGYFGGKKIMLDKYYPEDVMNNENVIVRWHHGQETFPKSWVFPTKKIDFYGVQVAIPNQPQKLLAHRYPWTYRLGISMPYKWKCYVPCWIRRANGC